MAAPPSSDTLPLPLPPIIKREHSPSNAALKSPQFASPPSPQPPTATSMPGTYFAPQPHHSPNPSGILLNKGESATSPPSLAHSPALHSPTAHEQQHLHQQQQQQHINHGLGMLRVASPDGGSATSESGFSSDGGFGASSASTAPSSAVGSPPAQGKPLLSTLLATPGPGAGDDRKGAQSPPSPHCHFAPLPKVDNDARPGTRRNSFANRVKPYRGQPERSDSLMSSLSVDTDDDGHRSPPYPSPGGDSSIPTPSALSQRLSSSLTFAAPPASTSQSPSRPASRRSSSSRRSRSPSPPGLHGQRSTSRTGHGHGGIYPHGHGASSRSHSPNLSRHASTDALSLHYIEAGAERDGAEHRRGAGAILSRTSSRAGSERDGGVGAGGAVSPGGGGDEGGAPMHRRTSVDRSADRSASGAGVGFVDRDKEADLHRLQEKAAHGNVDAERAVSPALKAQAARERSLSRGAAPSEEGEARQGRSEVVQVGLDGGKDDELEEVEEEPELEEVEEEEEGEGEGSAEEGSVEGENGTDEEEDEEEEEEGDERERSREDEDEEEEEDEMEDLAHEARATSKGAAVEVVRWHRPERDEPSPVPGAQIPRPVAPPVAAVPAAPTIALAAPAAPLDGPAQ
ncbi:hypothetical protein JCM10207_007404 [Rhodosporidiobolus poonsookiae]